ncbi:hypothetical protein [Christiangramia echinicola]|uniref:Sulfotransferase family protein n=1 Tax=Christiangramia echinicola TaxID=279359 RepID=A0A1H1L414_9FLAO|nr:hypothetical protein [Christiangramia echinicola]SDR69321.1 hypothetical protein SAMN04488552_0548 [Christiangramia echinicola]
MLLNEKFIYFELHKTGCTHTRDILKKIPGLDHQVIGKHLGYEAVPEVFKKDFENKVKIGNIRNPWEWYISLWAFGCKGKGMLYKQLTSKTYLFSINGVKSIIKNAIKLNDPFERVSLIDWNKLYSNQDNPENFRKWLNIILNNSNLDLGEGYKNSPVSHEIGLLTFRFSKLYTYDGKKRLQKIQDYQELCNYVAKANFIDVILKNEELHEHLLENSPQLGIDKWELKNILNGFHRNTNSSGWSKDLKFYDLETYELVKNKERLIIQKYEYEYNY